MGIIESREELRSIATVTLFDPLRSEQRRARSPLHILVVDDDPVTQALVRKIYEDRYCVTVCGDIFQAVNEYMRILPDLVLLDIALGDNEFDGLDVLHTLRMHDPRAYVVMVSGNASADNIAAAARAGASGFVMKPFQPSRLLAAAEECEWQKFRL